MVVKAKVKTKAKTKAKSKTTKKSTTVSKAKTTAKSKQRKSSNSESDQRSSGERIPIQLLVDYKADGHYLFDFCKDLGQGGVFIETKKPKKHGSQLELTFTLPDSKETLSTTGRVIWVQQPIANRNDLTPGMGVQFESFSSDERAILQDFIKRYSSQESAS